jgi:hypothetical protein
MAEDLLDHIGTAPPKLKPGMSHVVYGGEMLVIRDENNDELAVEARENKLVMEFLRAYAEERKMRQRGIDGSIAQSLHAETERCFTALPLHVARELL